MELYQFEGSSRTRRILIMGIVGLVVVAFVVIWQALAITVLSIIPPALVLLGFFSKRHQPLILAIPPGESVHLDFVVDGIHSQSYPQAILYRINLRNLHLLILPIALSVLSLLLVEHGWVKNYVPDNPLPLYGSLAAIFFAAFLALRWVNERTWIARAVTNCAIVGESGRGLLLLCSPETPEAGPVANAFRYHRFSPIDVKHISEQQLNESATRKEP